MRSPISNTFARFETAQAGKVESMIKNNTTFFVPWETIHESNPQEILDRKEKVALKPFLIMQGVLDNNMLPDVQTKFVQTYRAAGGSWVASAVTWARRRMASDGSGTAAPGFTVTMASSTSRTMATMDFQ